MTVLHIRRSGAMLLALAALLAGLASFSQAALNDPQELVPFLKIDLPGWQVQAGFPRMKHNTLKGQPFVEAQVVYTSGKSTVAGFIMDGAPISGEVATIRRTPLAETEKGYSRKISVQGFEGLEIYNKAKREGFIFIFVADHCLITLQAKEVESTQVLKDLVNKIKLPQLAALVK